MAYSKEQQRQYYQANKDRLAEQKRQYRQANKDRLAEQKRQYYQARLQSKLRGLRPVRDVQARHRLMVKMAAERDDSCA